MTATLVYKQRVAEILREFGIEPLYRQIKPFLEATELVPIGCDIYGREQKLAPKAAIAWHEMRSAAENEEIVLLMVSAFRSVAYQKQIIRRKLAAGQKMGHILHVSAAPGYSEHHTGRAIDVTTDDCNPLTEGFEQTPAFAWLRSHAQGFGYAMTYPSDNRFGVAYEPWHWTFHDPE